MKYKDNSHCTPHTYPHAHTLTHPHTHMYRHTHIHTHTHNCCLVWVTVDVRLFLPTDSTQSQCHPFVIAGKTFDPKHFWHRTLLSFPFMFISVCSLAVTCLACLVPVFMFWLHRLTTMWCFWMKRWPGHGWRKTGSNRWCFHSWQWAL